VFSFLPLSPRILTVNNRNSKMSWSQKLGGRGGNFSSTSGNSNNKILQDDAPSLPTTTSTSSSAKASNNNINKNNNNNNNKPTLSKAWANNTLIPKPHSQQQEEQQNQQQGQQQETLLTKLSNAKNNSKNKNDNDDDKANSNNKQQAAANSTASNNTKTNQIDYYVVLDFEATCQEGPRLKPQEIIEFPSVVVDANRCVIVAEFQRYVRPVHHPKLSQFCTDLTGIPQKVVDEASTFAVVYQQYFKWLESIGLTQKEASSRVAWVTCGDWDLKTMLPSQLKNPRPSREEEPEDAKCTLPRTAPLNFQRWVNLKFTFQKFVGRRPGGMTEMLEALGLTMTGHHHSGIDDCRNIARCLMAMLKKGNRVELTFGEFSPEETSWQVQRPAYAVLEKGGVSKDLAQLSKGAQEALQRTQAASKIQQQVNDVGNDSRNNRNNNNNNAAASSSSGTNTDSQAPSRRMRGMPGGNDDSTAAANNNNNNRNAAPTSSAPLSASGLLPIVEVDKSRNAIKEILTAANINMSQGPDAAQRAAFPQGPQQMTRVSKSLSSALRHNAIQWRIPMSLNGFVRVTDLTRNNHFHQTNPTQLAALCFTNDKQRFGLFFGATKETANTLYIRANQGHSIEELELDLERITDPRKAPIAVHGTYLAAWNAIRTQGLSRMNRQHIHLAKGLPGQNGVISGMRSSCQVLIYVNVPKMLKDGIPLYQSENGVLLTSGVDGILSPDYFEKVVDRRNNREIN